MDRRTLLVLLGGIGLGAYGVSADQPVQRARATVTEALDPGRGADVGAEPLDDEKGSIDHDTATSNQYSKTFGRPSYGFQSIRFNGDGSATIRFEEGHRMDGFGVLHEAETNLDIALVLESAPEGAGTKTVDFRWELEHANVLYPSRKFKLMAFKGTFDDRKNSANEGIDSVREHLGSVPFVIPEDVMPRNRLE